MPQIFTRYARLLLWVWSLAFLVLVMVAIIAWRFGIARPASEGEPVLQPLPFSHQHHVTDDGIDCRYCHTSVETGAHAGLPSTETCMTCHSQLYTEIEMLQPVVNSLRTGEPLRWIRVHDLPDFVYFHHGVHVSNGVGCSTCHGRVDLMPQVWRAKPLTMQWCLDCHRDPGAHLRGPDQIFDMAWAPPQDQDARGRHWLEHYDIQLQQLTDCSLCHR